MHLRTSRLHLGICTPHATGAEDRKHHNTDAAPCFSHMTLSRDREDVIVPPTIGGGSRSPHVIRGHMIASYNYCRLLTVFLQMLNSTKFQKCSVGFRFGNCGSRLSWICSSCLEQRILCVSCSSWHYGLHFLVFDAMHESSDSVCYLVL